MKYFDAFLDFVGRNKKFITVILAVILISLVVIFSDKITSSSMIIIYS